MPEGKYANEVRWERGLKIKWIVRRDRSKKVKSERKLEGDEDGIAGENIKWFSHYGKVYCFLKKLNIVGAAPWHSR